MNEQAKRRAEMDKRMQEAQARHDQAWQQRGSSAWPDNKAQQDQLYKDLQEREAQIQKEMEQRKAELQKDMQARNEEMRMQEQAMEAERQRYAPQYGQPYPQAQAPVMTHRGQ